MPTDKEIRERIWYKRYKWFAGELGLVTIGEQQYCEKRPAEVLKTFHRFLDEENKYGTNAIAESAERSLDLVIKDLGLE